MRKQTITTSTNQYDVIVGKGIIDKLNDFLPNKYRNIMIITDSTVHELYTEKVKKQLPRDANISVSVVPAGESSKSIDQYYRLLTNAIENQLDRKSVIIALGGGMRPSRICCCYVYERNRLHSSTNNDFSS